MSPAKRRDVLQFTGYGLLGVLAGCTEVLGSNDESTMSNGADGDRTAQVTAPDLTASPGESRTLEISVDDVAILYISSKSNGIEFDYEGAEAMPQPDARYSSDPPGWSWQSSQSVDLEIPVSVDEDAREGDHQYVVRAADRIEEASATDPNQLNEFTSTITVTAA